MIQESGETLAPALDFSYPKFLPQGPWAEAGTIFVFAVVAAWLSSWSLRLILKAIAGKTKTLLDDQVIEFLRGPVVKTVVLFGLAASATRLNLTEPALSGTIRSLLTLVLLVWAFALPKICGLLLGAASSQEDRFKAVGKSTLPLFDNLVKLLIFGLAVALQMAGIWFSASRGPFIGGMIAITLLFLGMVLVRSRAELIRSGLIAGIGLFGAAGIVFIPSSESSDSLATRLSIGSEVTNIGTGETSSDGGGGLSGRIQTWKNTLQLAQSWDVPQEESTLKRIVRPLFGL
ncbi:MAG: hypothetical protein QF745_06890, partial [Planctomycetota bacterium]|nr:hypothetical protein [Planctomycetota bacterium]